MAISKSAPSTASIGSNFTYTLTVSNTSTSTSNGQITVTDALSQGLAFVSGSGNGWECSASGQNVICTSSTAISVNGSVNILLTVNPTQSGTYVNVASVVGGGDNSNTNSNSVSTVINPASAPSLSVTKAGPSTGTVGVNYNYTLTVANIGTSATNGQITVTDVLPTGLNFVSAMGSGWSCSASRQTVSCTTNNAIVANANSAITLTVNPVLAGNYNNTFTASGGGTT